MDTDIECSQLDPSGYVEHQVPHVRQRHSWDCGVACVMMLLPREQRLQLHSNLELIAQQEGFYESTWTIDLCYLLKSWDGGVACVMMLLHRVLERVAQQEGFYKSTWTIDLCFLLKRYNIEHCMYTTMPGVNEENSKLSYYDKIINLDRDRVQRRFAEAAARGLRVTVGRVGGAQLLAHLAQGPAIVLVDAGLLACDLCKYNKLRAEFRRCFGGSYRGHYILVVGYAAGGARARVLYRDPARGARLCACSLRALHAARDAPGTDHDVLLVYKNFR